MKQALSHNLLQKVPDLVTPSPGKSRLVEQVPWWDVKKASDIGQRYSFPGIG